VEKGPEGDREFAANAVRNGGGNQGTNHSSDRQLTLRLVDVRQ
jgi:general stress protein YciG